MSKNLTQEYKNLASNDLPDLWSRIEAGITDGNTTAPSNEKEVYRDFEVEKVKTVKLEPTSYQNRYVFVRRYGGLIAAFTCAAVILPVIFFNRSIHDSYFSTDSSGNMALAPAAVTDAAQIVPEAMADMESGAGTLDEMDISVREAGTTAGVASMESNNETEFRTDDVYDWNNELSAQLARESYFPEAQIEKRVEIHRVEVEIYDFCADGIEDIPNVYSATIISDEADVLNTYISIYLVKNEGVEAHLAVGETYTVDLVYEEAVLYFEVTKVW